MQPIGVTVTCRLWLHIHGGAVNELLQQLIWNIEAPLRVADGHEDWISCILSIAPSGGPVCEFFTPCRLIFGLVIRDVIGMPHERVNGAHGVALMRRQRNKGVVEVFCLSFGDRTTCGICRVYWLLQAIDPAGRTPGTKRPASAYSSSSALRGLDIVGRGDDTSYFCASIARRISRPPRVNRSRSTASSRSTMPISFAPRANIARV